MTNDEAKDYIREWCPYDRQEEIIKALQQEPKTGHWIEHHRTDLGEKLNDMCECSECGKWFSICELLYRSYCPNCGAKMQEVNE